MRLGALLVVLAALALSGCFSPNPWAIANAGPRITSVTAPSNPLAGQTSHWVVNWGKGESPYSIVLTAYPETGAPVTYSASNITTPHSFDVTLPPAAGTVSWRIEIRDSLYSEGGGFGNPFVPSYNAMDSREGTLTTQAAP